MSTLQNESNISVILSNVYVLCANSSVQIENHLVTQTVELMNHTNRIKSMIEMYNEEMVRTKYILVE